MPVFILKEFDGTIAAESRRLENLGKSANELLPVMVAIAKDMMLVETKLFSSQGRRGGGSWKPLKKETIKRKGHSTIMVKTGALKASLTEFDAPFQILNIGETFVQFGTDVPYAQYQDEGTSVLPRRPIMKLIPSDEKRWNRMIVDHLMKAHRV